jgi:uncharacterized membrane protein HdeD (DUF308 family)
LRRAWARAQKSASDIPEFDRRRGSARVGCGVEQPLFGMPLAAVGPSPEHTMATHADLPQSPSSASDASRRSGSRSSSSADTSLDGGLDHPGRGWRIAWGVLLIVSGVLAVMMPAVAALATAVVFGWLLILAGVFEIAYSWHGRARRGFGWQLASGLLTLVLGIAVLVVPLAGVLSLALLVAGFLLAGGIARSVLAWKVRPRAGWGWVLADGLFSIGMAILIALGWPQVSFALVGVLTGFSLIGTGVWRIALRDVSASALPRAGPSSSRSGP